LLVLLVPWHRYLPGFVLYQSYSPFLLIKYAPQIFFLSLVAALLGIPLSYFLLRCLTDRPMQITASDTFSLAPGKPLC
jgi:hypothetical protein